MLVVERMRRSPTTVTVGTTAGQALELLEGEKLRNLPVVDGTGSLAGILSEKDLSRAPAGEPVERVMTPYVVTVGEYTTIEEAARIMADRKITSLPVVRGHKLVGMITDVDLFRIFLELLAAREPGLRVTMLIPEERGMLAKVTSEIASLGGNILALTTFRGEDPTNRMVTVKVTDVPKEKLVAIMEALGMEIVDVREV